MIVTVTPKPISLFLMMKLLIRGGDSLGTDSGSVLDLTWSCGVNDFVAFKLSFGFFPRHVQLGGAQDFGTKPSW